MKEEYYFSFDEPTLYNKEIICAFFISNIERKRGFFFIVIENDKLMLYYSLVSNFDLVKFVREYKNKMNLNKKKKFTDVINITDLKKEYNNKYLKCKEFNNPSYIKKIINKMSKDNIYNANNQIQGFDGFSVKLKLDKQEKYFYSWCFSDDKKYFYVIDFVNSILDELKIKKEYRFEKMNNK